MSDKSLSNEMMTKIQEMRRNLPAKDFQAAEVLKNHCLSLLSTSLIKYVDIDGNDQQRSTLTPSDLSSIARALEVVQKVQHLALGVSGNKKEEE